MHHRLAASVLLFAGLAIAEIVAPLSIKTCADDQHDVAECRWRALAEAVPLLATGIPQIGAAPIDPLEQLPPLALHAGSSGLNFKFRLDNARLTGLGRSITDNLQVDSINNRIRVVSHTKGASIEGAYTMVGHVLGVPLDGTGIFKIIMNSGTVDVTYSGHLEIGHGGQSYLKLDTVHVTLALGETQYELTGLFGDFQPLVHAGNVFINSVAPKLVQPQILPTLESWLAEAFRQRAQAVFSTVPYDQLFPKTSAYTGFYRAVFPHYF